MNPAGIQRLYREVMRPAGGSDLRWMDWALCAEVDPELFFPEKGQSTGAAKRVCAKCDVRAECLEYALENAERYGIWGQASERDRRGMRQQRRAA